MNKKLLFSLLLAGTAFTGHADEARLLRFPATNGSDIVFSYAGDLYKAPLNGGEAQKLTSHIGYEMFARFSPDGKSIAFTGQYDGNTEVYLIPTDGGEPQRLSMNQGKSHCLALSKLNPRWTLSRRLPLLSSSLTRKEQTALSLTFTP